MSGIARLMQMGAAGAGNHPAPIFIEDVFSTYLYTGNGSTQTITNGIDLAGEGGLVWVKTRAVPDNHSLVDTERGGNFELNSNTTSGQGGGMGFSFNSDGFTLGSSIRNANTAPYASWTFRKAPRFFDVVSGLTSDGSGNLPEFNHSLGTKPGCVFLKATDSGSNWVVFHRGLSADGANQYIQLNTTNAATNATGFGVATPTTFEVGAGSALVPSVTYVAYLFAHDPLGPSEDGSDGLIACGSYTGNGSTNGPEVDLGWEPQWLLVKSSTYAVDWLVYDNMRGASSNNTVKLQPNTSNAEDTLGEPIGFNATGFQPLGTDSEINRNANTYIYIAIRRGPMRAPTSGTEVFKALTYSGTGSQQTLDTLEAADFSLSKTRDNSDSPAPRWYDRLRGNNNYLRSSTTSAEVIDPSLVTSFTAAQKIVVDLYESDVLDSYVNYTLRRAPGFFDVVAYTSQGTSFTINHNLKAVPELMIFKNRDSATFNWVVWSNTNNYLRLNTSDARYMPDPWGGTLSSTQISIPAHSGTADNINPFSVNKHIAYLFATLPGISKVGSYTGNGSSQTINCGFTSGARFVLIKRTDSTGDWYVWDTARGIVTGNDPHLSLNTTAAEVTTNDSIDPDSSGFIVNQVAATNINVSSASYIFYAIA